MKTFKTDFEYRNLSTKLINSDPDYQRVVDMNRVRTIVTNFNPDLVNPIKVSLRVDGKYYVFDGQHTLSAMKMKNNNKDLLVECKVYNGLTKQDEAKLFSEQNGISRNVKSSAKLKALYTAGDEEIIRLYDTINKMGITFDFTEYRKDNKIVACATIYKIYRSMNQDDFVDMLTIVKESWGGAIEGYAKEILTGMQIFYSTYKDRITIQKAIKQFKKVSPMVIIREGKVATTGGNKRFARQLLYAYNHKTRGKLADIIG